jgi:putative membrane protein
MWHYDPAVTPYCGAPPSPGNFWFRWNLDPILITGLFVLACLYAIGTVRLDRRECRLGRGEQTAFWAGWTVTVAALISPLCPLSVSLFAARVGQHMILALIAAPLVAAGRPVAVSAAALGRTDAPLAPARAAPLTAIAVFTALLWFWHAPAAYAATFASAGVYWAMHLSMFASALWLWSALLDRASRHPVTVVLASVIASVQMGFLGALITFAPRPLYAPHALTTWIWGFSPLQDQQLGGAIMWIPGCIVFLAVAMIALWRTLARSGWAEPDAGPVVLRAP